MRAYVASAPVEDQDDDEERHEYERARGEQPEDARLVPQVHVVQRDHHGLDDGGADEEDNLQVVRDSPGGAERGNLDLHDRDNREEREHGHVRALELVGDRLHPSRRPRRRRHRHRPMRYMMGNRKIHTTSTRCQYKPTISTPSELSFPYRPFRAIAFRYASPRIPPVTCAPWKPVCT